MIETVGADRYLVFGTLPGDHQGELRRQKIFGPTPRMNEATREADRRFARGIFLTVEVVDGSGKVVALFDRRTKPGTSEGLHAPAVPLRLEDD